MNLTVGLMLLGLAATGTAGNTQAPGISCRDAQAAGEGIVPAIFAPGTISGGAHDAAPTFTPDGATVFFSRSNPSGAAIMVSHRMADGWTTPAVAPFSGEWNDMEPVMAPDGSYLLFISSRPAAPGQPQIDGFVNNQVQPGQGGNIWRVDREGDGWGAPRRLPEVINAGTSVFAPALARDGTLYFMRSDPDTRRFRLYRAEARADGYEAPQPLPFSTGEATDVDPAVDPDQRFLIFGSGRYAQRGIDLFIVERQGDGWGVPVHLGKSINTPQSDAEPRLSADGATLYFSSERTIAQSFPRTRADADVAMTAADRWNNGQYNVWSVPMADVFARVVGRRSDGTQTPP